jgi:hypothetical protein
MLSLLRVTVLRCRDGTQIYFKNQTPAPGTAHPVHLALEDVLALVIDSFTGATERHIEVSMPFPAGSRPHDISLTNASLFSPFNSD